MLCCVHFVEVQIMFMSFTCYFWFICFGSSLCRLRPTDFFFAGSLLSNLAGFCQSRIRVDWRTSHRLYRLCAYILPNAFLRSTFFFHWDFHISHRNMLRSSMHSFNNKPSNSSFSYFVWVGETTGHPHLIHAREQESGRACIWFDWKHKKDVIFASFTESEFAHTQARALPSIDWN